MAPKSLSLAHSSTYPNKEYKINSVSKVSLLVTNQAKAQKYLQLSIKNKKKKWYLIIPQVTDRPTKKIATNLTTKILK